MAQSQRWHVDAYEDAVWASKLSPKARLTVLAYARYVVDERGHRTAFADLAKLTHDQLQRMTGIGRRSDVSRYVQEAVDAGWLSVVREAHRRSTVYRLTIPAAAGAAEPQPTSEGTTDSSSPPDGTTDDVAGDEMELPNSAGSSTVGTTGSEPDKPSSSDVGTTVVPFSEAASSDVGTTVVPTSELHTSLEEIYSSSSSARRPSIAYVADRLKIDDDEAKLVISKIKGVAWGDISSLMRYLGRISDEDLAEHLAEVRDRRQPAAPRTASVLQFPRPAPPADDAPHWRAVAARQLPVDPAAQARRAAAAAAARARISPSGPAPKTTTRRAAADIDAVLAEMYPQTTAPEVPEEEVAA